MADISGYLNNIRSAESGETVRDSIIQCLNKINNDNPNKTKPLNVTANGTYTSETGYSYNPVTVNVPAGGSSNYTFEELEVTENGEYEPEEDNTMYKKVTVNVPQLANDLAPDGYTITQNGEYDPLLDGYDGYGKIIVNVNEATGDGPFTVNFYDAEGRMIETDTVNKYGRASCTLLDGTVINGQYFKGWNPSPDSVTRDLKCYPIYADPTIDPNEIQDSWEVICQDGGAHYPLGSYKSLIVNVPARSSGESYWWETTNDGKWGTVSAPLTGAKQIAMHMVKVGEGEDGSRSSWLSTGLIQLNFNWNNNGSSNWSAFSNMGGFAASVVKPSGSSSAEVGPVSFDWGTSLQREYLNNYLIENIPEILGRSIKPVSKQYTSYARAPIFARPDGIGTNYGDVKIYKTSVDRIWIPSMHELHTLFAATNLYDDFKDNEELTGIDYSAIYVPNYADMITRTACVYTNSISPITRYTQSWSGTSFVGREAGETSGYPIGFCL